ncbi:hypothetical protein LY76DRAFT_12946 [Colletotrichum caudatum]|nr:hypothetical protein LY76DRAFT_12946 [Colletotrichum caudatum]
MPSRARLHFPNKREREREREREKERETHTRAHTEKDGTVPLQTEKTNQSERAKDGSREIYTAHFFVLFCTQRLVRVWLLDTLPRYTDRTYLNCLPTQIDIGWCIHMYSGHVQRRSKNIGARAKARILFSLSPKSPYYPPPPSLLALRIYRHPQIPVSFSVDYGYHT